MNFKKTKGSLLIHFSNIYCIVPESFLRYDATADISPDAMTNSVSALTKLSFEDTHLVTVISWPALASKADAGHTKLAKICTTQSGCGEWGKISQIEILDVQ